MRFSIELKFHSPQDAAIELPIRYQKAFLYLFKTGLSHVDSELFAHLYKKNTPKLFCFAANFPNAKFFKNAIVLGERQNAYWQLSTDDVQMGLSFYNALIYLHKNGPWPFNKYVEVTFSAPVQVKEPVIVTDEIKVKTLSPLVVRQDKRLFLSGTKEADLENFNLVLKENMQSRFQDYYPKAVCALIEELTYTPINTRKTVIKSFDINVEATVGTFTLTANSTLLNIILKNGLGIRTGNFSGYLKIVD